jgi:hypothetical protein
MFASNWHKTMKKIKQQTIRTQCGLWGLAISMGLLQSCVSMAPVNSTFESAQTLDKGQVEIMGNYSSYSIRDKDEMETETISKEKVNNNFGFRVGYGISDRFDLKFRYERLRPELQEDKDQVNGINYFTLSSRYSLLEDHIAAAVDLSLYGARTKPDEYSETNLEMQFVITPRLAFSYPSTKNFDFTLGTKMDIFTDGGYAYWGWNLGCGISPGEGNWMLRPEAGLMMDVSELSYGIVWFNWGLGVVVKIDARPK